MGIRLVLVFLLIFSCSLFQNENDLSNLELELLGEWARSFEEEVQPWDGNALFRRAEEVDFPGALFRDTFRFYENNECETLYLAPNDAHYFIDCTWEIDPVGDTYFLKLQYEMEEIISSSVEINDIGNDELSFFILDYSHYIVD